MVQTLIGKIYPYFYAIPLNEKVVIRDLFTEAPNANGCLMINSCLSLNCKDVRENNDLLVTCSEISQLVLVRIKLAKPEFHNPLILAESVLKGLTAKLFDKLVAQSINREEDKIRIGDYLSELSLLEKEEKLEINHSNFPLSLTIPQYGLYQFEPIVLDEEIEFQKNLMKKLQEVAKNNEIPQTPQSP